jgi:hypothetical protein
VKRFTISGAAGRSRPELDVRDGAGVRPVPVRVIRSSALGVTIELEEADARALLEALADALGYWPPEPKLGPGRHEFDVDPPRRDDAFPLCTCPFLLPAGQAGPGPHHVYTCQRYREATP